MNSEIEDLIERHGEAINEILDKGTLDRAFFEADWALGLAIKPRTPYLWHKMKHNPARAQTG